MLQCNDLAVKNTLDWTAVGEFKGSLIVIFLNYHFSRLTFYKNTTTPTQGQAIRGFPSKGTNFQPTARPTVSQIIANGL